MITRFTRWQIAFTTRINCCGDDPPAAPDTSRYTDFLIDLGERAREIGDETLQFAKDSYTESKQVVDQVLGVQIPMMQNLWQNYQQGKARYNDVFQPLADNLVDEALTYNTQARQELEAGRNAARVEQAAEAERANTERRLQGYGVDPSQLRAGALDLQYAVDTAAAKVAASNKGRQAVEDTGRALRDKAIALGIDERNFAQSEGQLAANVGATAAKMKQDNYLAGVQGRTAVAPFYNAATSAGSAALTGINQGYQNELEAYDAAGPGFFESALGLAAGVGSSYVSGGLAGPAVTNITKANADGGSMGSAIPEGVIEGPGGNREDAISARLSSDEYIIPADVVKRKGTEFFDKMLEKTREGLKQAKTAEAVPVGSMPPPKAALPGGV